MTAGPVIYAVARWWPQIRKARTTDHGQRLVVAYNADDTRVSLLEVGTLTRTSAERADFDSYAEVLDTIDWRRLARRLDARRRLFKRTRVSSYAAETAKAVADALRDAAIERSQDVTPAGRPILREADANGVTPRRAIAA